MVPADRKFKRPFGATPIPRRPPRSRLLPRTQGAADAPPEAAHSAAERDCRWCWTGVSGWGRVAPQGCPGVKASGKAVGKEQHRLNHTRRQHSQ